MSLADSSGKAFSWTHFISFLERFKSVYLLLLEGPILVDQLFVTF